jgi:hypothetical protein
MTKDEALKMAIETNEWLKSHLWVDSLAGEELDKVTNACKEALEQPVQEPVALTEAVAIVLEGFNIPSDVRKILETAYYTNPHQWQGLTADELEDIKDNSKEGWYQLVRNVEQALKEKNT